MRTRGVSVQGDTSASGADIRRARGALSPVARTGPRHRDCPVTDHLLRVESLVKRFPVRGGALNRVIAQVQAVNGVSFAVKAGEVLGLVGESGSGKTTVGRLVLRLEEATAGKVIFDGSNILELSRRDMRRFRKRMQ
ncbi:MAG TPA: ABC transporter ATP-binding protein, partial [Gemmatimonadetes bacterium]|nr:ABC transporter ATP-binding protein [Gemmatimonadota bacterium]